jgi:hypothetical protein
MKINKLVLMCAAFASIIIANPFATQAQSPAPAPSASPVITWTATGKQSEKNVDVLFVQNAKNVSFSEGKLVLRGVNSVTVCFTDRPARMAGHMQTSKFVPLWSQGKDSFLKDNPNATLSVFSGDNVSDLVVELSNPKLSGDDLTYDTRILEGTLPAGGDLVRCSSTSSACPPRQCLTPVLLAVPIVANCDFAEITNEWLPSEAI